MELVHVEHGKENIEDLETREVAVDYLPIYGLLLGNPLQDSRH